MTLLHDIETLAQQHWNELNFPHLNKVIPASCLVEFHLENAQKETIWIDQHTELCTETNLGYLFRSKTLYKTPVLPFSIQDYSQHKLILNCHQHDFIWSTDIPLRIYIRDNIKLFNTLRHSKVLIDQKIPGSIRPISLADENDTHFRLPILFCNRPENLTFLDIYPSKNSVLSTDTFEINFESTLTTELYLHCTPIINQFESTSEPIALVETKSEYEIIPQYHISPDYLKLSNQFTKYITQNKTPGILSLPISCHQNKLYRHINNPEWSFYTENKENLASVKSITPWKPAIIPTHSPPLTESLHFNYLHQHSPSVQANLLKHFFSSHHYGDSALIKDCLAQIESIALSLRPENRVNYHITFLEDHLLIPSLIDVIKQILSEYRPITVEVNLSYEISHP